jgi:hypothetical protein
VRSDDLDVTSPSEVESLDVVRRARHARSVDQTKHLVNAQLWGGRARTRDPGIMSAIPLSAVLPRLINVRTVTVIRRIPWSWFPSL